MSVLRHRLTIAGVITAAAIAIPAAALASGPGAPSGKPAPPQAAAPSAGKSAAPAPSQAPAASKSAAAQSQPNVPAAVKALATRLGVSTDAAGRAFKQISGLINQNGRIDPASPAFAAIARGLGVSPAQLAAAWNAVG
jgi:hypothetical protein